MQKKIIALAVAGLMSGAAFAQSNVTIYGLVDMGYSYRSNNVNSAVDSRSGVDSGQQSGNRLGFKGEEAIGGGNKVGFVLEQGFATDTGVFGANGGSGVGFGRQAFLYAAGGWGTVAAGRMYTPQFTLLTTVDPFGTGTVGQANNVYIHTTRLDNLAAYVSPSFGGFNVVVGYTPNAGGNEAADDTATAAGAGCAVGATTGVITCTTNPTTANTRVYAIAPTYANGPIYVGFNYHNIKADGASFSTKVWDLGGSYDLGVVKLAGMYGRDTDLNAGGQDRAKWFLGLTAPLGNGAVLASYGRVKVETGSTVNSKANQWAVGYQYNLSKRSNLYAVYADIDNKVGTTYSVGDASNVGGGYESGFSVGLRHKF
jgi:predicted porin